MNIKKYALFGSIFILALLLVFGYYPNPAQEKEEISKVINGYFSNLANELRGGGVTGIEITSENIRLGWWGKATADAGININVYFPPTGEKRVDKDNVHFSLIKSDGSWEIKETKFDKTRF
ncbi:MAG TPA: hypothetical protein VJI52_05690 [Candidatus Nanoarchaeia archaeon]|nr:hypothetical protein [Candidatus Nanoarchaeia archaeon]